MTKYTFNLRAPSIKSLKLKRPGKRVILAAVVTLVVLGALVASLASYQRHKQAEHQQAVLAAQKQAQADTAAKQIARQKQEDFTAAVARGDQACAYVRSLAANKAVARYVSVPATCR